MCCISSFFFFNDTATTEIYTLSLHDALPILSAVHRQDDGCGLSPTGIVGREIGQQDRKSTRLNSSHGYISYAVFCLKKKKYKSGCAAISTVLARMRILIRPVVSADSSTSISC